MSTSRSASCSEDQTLLTCATYLPPTPSANQPTHLSPLGGGPREPVRARDGLTNPAAPRKEHHRENGPQGVPNIMRWKICVLLHVHAFFAFVSHALSFIFLSIFFFLIKLADVQHMHTANCVTEHSDAFRCRYTSNLKPVQSYRRRIAPHAHRRLQRAMETRALNITNLTHVIST